MTNEELYAKEIEEIKKKKPHLIHPAINKDGKPEVCNGQCFKCLICVDGICSDSYEKWLKQEATDHTTRKDCLQQAIDIVCKDREDTYGKHEDNFKIIADLWSTYTGSEITSNDVAMMMCLLKIARIKTGKYKADNYIDLAGYSACACENGNKTIEK